MTMSDEGKEKYDTMYILTEQLLKLRSRLLLQPFIGQRAKRARHSQG